MDAWVLAVFAAVYIGMMLGRIPGLAVDRTGLALLGAVILLAMGRISVPDAWASADAPTLGLLLGLMIVSAQLRIAGVYNVITTRIAQAPVSPPMLLGAIIVAAGVLSAVLANDIVCLAMTPLLVEGCIRRKLDPLPHLLGLAAAANVGSAATLIGNPQNMLIGQKLGVSFAGYMMDAAVPALLGLVATWAILSLRYRGRWEKKLPVVDAPINGFQPWQAGKGIAILVALVACFLFTDWPREVLALAGAGLILLSRHTATHRYLDLVDWQLLVLFIGLFVVNHALQEAGWLTEMLRILREAGVHLDQPAMLFGVTAVLSNLVSNVPAVMLLLSAAEGPQAPAILALASTLAGNFIIVGSIANIIVVTQAARLNIRISVWEHAKSGIPITLVTLTIAAGWLWLRAA